MFRGDTILETGLRLAVAREADEWRDIPYPVEYEEGGGSGDASQSKLSLRSPPAEIGFV